MLVSCKAFQVHKRAIHACDGAGTWDIDGARLDLTGEVSTILGPRSVAGVIGTDNDDIEYDLEARLAAGEKEYVGDHGGKPLAQPTDIWVCDSFPFEGVIADRSNDPIVEIEFENREATQKVITCSQPMRSVTSEKAMLTRWPRGEAELGSGAATRFSWGGFALVGRGPLSSDGLSEVNFKRYQRAARQHPDQRATGAA